MGILLITERLFSRHFVHSECAAQIQREVLWPVRNRAAQTHLQIESQSTEAHGFFKYCID
jgi:hypothetical protein